jgi:hypothetical protein
LKNGLFDTSFYWLSATIKKLIPILPIAKKAKKFFKNFSPDGAATLPKIINLMGQLKHPGF